MTAFGKIVLPGGAGLVGQNLIVALKARGVTDIVVIDKHKDNLAKLAALQPNVKAIDADIAEPGDWADAFEGAAGVVILQAQIGGLYRDEFVRNNVTATEHVLKAIGDHKVPYYVHISSSVVNSKASDFYTETKEAQEKLVDASPVPHCVLRPTLMFGWFDRKHLGWLARFMQRVPVFPIPGSGKYIRQPLYAMDFCNVIIACLEKHASGSYNISGRRKIFYIDLIRELKRANAAKALVMRIPYWLFHTLLTVYALFDKNPPFTVKQLKALVTPDEFEVIDWPGIFGVEETPLPEAMDQTYNDPVYSEVVLQF